MKLFQSHKQEKEKKILEFNWIEAGLTAGGVAVLLVSLAQPKNPANMLRLPVAFSMFLSSCIVERLRENDLLSFERSSDYEKNIKSDRIAFDTVIHEELKKLEYAEEVFARLPVDRHAEFAQKLGINPPNYSARQPDPMIQSVSAPAVSAPVQAQQVAVEQKLPDPTGDFDPEQSKDVESESESSGMIFAFAAQVEQWFEQMGDAIPESLRQEWRDSPGKGIEVKDGSARVVR